MRSLEPCAEILREAKVMLVVSSLTWSVLQQYAGGENKRPVVAVTALHYLAGFITGSPCRPEAGFPIVWCWNIPQGGPGTLKVHGFGPMPAFSLRILWTRARSHQGTHSFRVLLLGCVRTFHSLYLYLQTLISNLQSLSFFSFHTPLHVCSVELHMVSCPWRLLSCSLF